MTILEWPEKRPGDTSVPRSEDSGCPFVWSRVDRGECGEGTEQEARDVQCVGTGANTGPWL